MGPAQQPRPNQEVTEKDGNEGSVNKEMGSDGPSGLTQIGGNQNQNTERADSSDQKKKKKKQKD